MSDAIVYDARTDYVGYVDLDDGEAGWYRWPAESGGWAQRKRLDRAPDIAMLVRLGPTNTQLALRLSGVSRQRTPHQGAEAC
jgi:hypothetical protein